MSLFLSLVYTFKCHRSSVWVEIWHPLFTPFAVGKSQGLYTQIVSLPPSPHHHSGEGISSMFPHIAPSPALSYPFSLIIHICLSECPSWTLIQRSFNLIMPLNLSVHLSGRHFTRSRLWVSLERISASHCLNLLHICHHSLHCTLRSHLNMISLQRWLTLHYWICPCH